MGEGACGVEGERERVKGWERERKKERKKGGGGGMK